MSIKDAYFVIAMVGRFGGEGVIRIDKRKKEVKWGYVEILGKKVELDGVKSRVAPCSDDEEDILCACYDVTHSVLAVKEYLYSIGIDIRDYNLTMQMVESIRNRYVLYHPRRGEFYYVGTLTSYEGYANGWDVETVRIRSVRNSLLFLCPVAEEDYVNWKIRLRE